MRRSPFLPCSWILAAVWILSLAPERADGSECPTGARTVRPADGNPRRAILEDFNGDGRLDLARSDGHVGTVQIALGDGTGDFSNIQTLEGFDLPAFLLAAQLDAATDSRVDLAVVNVEGRKVSILAGAGDGTFAELSAFPVSGDPKTIAAGDFDEDGHVDLAVGLLGVDHFSVHFGDGNGTFDRPVLVAAGASPRSVHAADFDADGHLDLAAAAQEGDAFSVFLGAGDGTFVRSFRAEVAGSARGLASARLDADPHLDLVVTHDVPGEPGRLAVWLGDGSGQFTPSIVPEHPAGSYTTMPRILDFDEDGSLDVLLLNALSGTVSYYRGNGLGNFEAPCDSDFGAVLNWLTTGDVDEDGHADLLVSSARENYFVFELNGRFDPLLCRTGNVDASSGVVTDVLFANDSAGAGDERIVRVAPSDALELRIDAPPAIVSDGGRARFVLYGWLRPEIDTTTVHNLKANIGAICLPPPFLRGGPEPNVIWNNLGREEVLGEPTRPSEPAPHVLLSLPRGVGRDLTIFLQGVVIDPASNHGALSVTNGIRLEIGP